jgi:P4 family phage/plasmid primase-like protien
MTDKSNRKKLDKYRHDVIDFLSKNRYVEDGEHKHTHQSWGNIIQGKFFLDKDKVKEFLKLYCTAVENGVNDFSILEIQKDYSPIIIDIDLKAPNEGTFERLYDEEMVKTIISKYIEAINIYLDVGDQDYKICLFEKKRPTDNDDVIKDGFHIIFPDLCVHTKLRHLIRDTVVKSCENLFEDFLENTDKIIDKAVVSSNGWFLYGSRKPCCEPYSLTKIYDSDLKIIYDCEIDEKLKDTYIIEYLSLHKKSKRYCKKAATNVNERFAESDIEVAYNKLRVDTSSNNMDTKYFRLEAKEDVIRRATKFTNMLSDDRSNNYEEWRNVGLALHNTDDSLLSVWMDFSGKSSKFRKAVDGNGDCKKFWKQFKTPSSGSLLTIRSLAYWAKEDSPKEFDAYEREEFKNTLRKSLDKSTFSLAKAFYTKFSDRFVCSSTKTNLWWEFKDNRWNRVDDAYTIKILLSEDFANEYNKEICEMTMQATKVSGMEKEEIQQKLTRICGIVEKLMNIVHKKNIIEDAKTLFYDPKFEEKLDSNIYLIGFENGVYDLEHKVFRNGRPDDYIHNSTGYAYRKYSDTMLFKTNIDNFFEQILPNKSVRDFFKVALATCISGETKEEKLYILTGSGSNGKSLTVDLMIQALGNYYMSCPITMITRKRGQSNDASPEKVRMKGKRFGVFQETDEGERINVGIMKEFTGGDKVLVRDLFKGSNEMIEFKPQMKYFLTCNQLPSVPSNDDGTWRRLRVIEFGSKFTDNPSKPNEFLIDKNLKQEIRKWGPSFMSYLINIYEKQYKDKPMVEPVEVMASTNQYKMENDFYTEFIIEKINGTDNPKNVISKDMMWETFRAWYKTNYEGKPLPKRPDMLKFMNKAICEPNRKGYYECVVFNTPHESDEDAPKNDLDV